MRLVRLRLRQLHQWWRRQSVRLAMLRWPRPCANATRTDAASADATGTHTAGANADAIAAPRRRRRQAVANTAAGTDTERRVQRVRCGRWRQRVLATVRIVWLRLRQLHKRRRREGLRLAMLPWPRPCADATSTNTTGTNAASADAASADAASADADTAAPSRR